MLGTPFVLLLIYIGIALNNVFLVLPILILLLFVYVFLARDNYYFELTSNELNVFNDFIPWKKRSFHFDEISNIKDGVVSIILTTKDKRVREFRASLSSKGIEDLLKDMKKKAPLINYEEWKS